MENSSLDYRKNYILKYKKNMGNLYIPIHVILRWLIG